MKLFLSFCIFLLLFVCTDGSTATFGHGRKSHRPIPCSSCHTVTVARQNVTRFPGHSTCTSCHNFAEMASVAFSTFCGICHAGTPQSAARPALFSFPPRKRSSEFGISFSHSSHLKAVIKSTGTTSAVKCRDCHSVVESVGGRVPAKEVIIGDAHENCFRCHGMKPEKPPAMNQCAGCHKMGGPKSPELHGIVPKFAHLDHMYDIRPKKKAEYAIKTDLCVECHANVAGTASLQEIRLPETTFCSQCHSGRFGLPERLPKEVLNTLAYIKIPNADLFARKGR